MPPPLNSSNLLDICHALEAVNITQQDRTSLGVQQTDELSTILTKLNTSLKQYAKDLDDVQLSTIANNYSRVYYGQYVGNGNSTYLSINFPSVKQARLVFIVENRNISDLRNGQAFGWCLRSYNQSVESIFNVYNPQISANHYVMLSVTFKDGTIIIGDNNSSYVTSLNIRNITYSYMIFE